MKKALLVFLFIGFVFTSCKNGNTDNIVTVSTNDKTQSTLPKAIEEKAFAKLSIDGMTCAIGCAATIEKKLNQTTGVASATVNFESKTAWVIYDAKVMGLEKISEVVKATGPSYKVTSIEQVQSLNP